MCSEPRPRRRGNAKADTHVSKRHFSKHGALATAYRCPEPSHGVPTGQCREATPSTTNGRTTRNVRKRRITRRVQPWVQEPESRLAGCYEGVIDQSQDGGGRGGRGARPVKDGDGSVPDGSEALALSGDVGIPSTFLVVQTVELTAQTRDVVSDDVVVVLIVGAREVIAETATAREAVSFVECRDFGVEVLGGADAGYVGAAVWEGGKEGSGVVAIIGEAVSGSSYTVVATCGEEGCAFGSQLSEELADFFGVMYGNGLLVVTVGRADDLRKSIHVQDCVKKL